MASIDREPAAESGGSTSKDKGNEALALMVRALELIDSNAGPLDAGAHLDLAIHRLRDWLDSRS